MRTSPRNGPIDLIVVHTNEGPQTEGGAQALADYLQTIDGGYNAICDDKNTITVADDQTVVWGAGGVNERAIHVCLVGSANQTSLQWGDGYGIGEARQASQWVAGKCRQHGIPPVKLTPGQVAAGVKGVCGHADVSAVYAASQGHYDPGPNFPWAVFMASVSQMLDPLVYILPRSRGGGAWWAHASGAVDFIGPNGMVTHGGMVTPSDRKAFAGRTVKKLEPRLYRCGLFIREGYTIIDTANESYVPQGQR